MHTKIKGKERTSLSWPVNPLRHSPRPDAQVHHRPHCGASRPRLLPTGRAGPRARERARKGKKSCTTGRALQDQKRMNQRETGGALQGQKRMNQQSPRETLSENALQHDTRLLSTRLHSRHDSCPPFPSALAFLLSRPPSCSRFSSADPNPPSCSRSASCRAGLRPSLRPVFGSASLRASARSLSKGGVPSRSPLPAPCGGRGKSVLAQVQEIIPPKSDPSLT